MAETLWPEADSSHAMDSLYKACRVLRALIRQGIPLPLIQNRDTLLLEGHGIDSDVERFLQLYQQREDAACRAAAIELYQAPFLLNEYYEWTARLEAYYDIRYLELLQLAADSAQRAGDTATTAYYQRLLSSDG